MNRAPECCALSLGAGVQSTTLLLMAERGEIERPAAAVFADTGWEPLAVYRHLEWLMKTVKTVPIRIVRAGDIRRDALAFLGGERSRFANMPLHVQRPSGERGFFRRQCTGEYKVEPVRRALRALLDNRVRTRSIDLLLGISTDEADRQRDSRVQYVRNRYPLIERGMSRADCLNWLEERDYPRPPKSSCIGCPYNSLEKWRAVREVQGEWREALVMDAAVRDWPGADGPAYLSRRLMPLIKAIEEPEDDQPNLFRQECEGHCGT